MQPNYQCQIPKTGFFDSLHFPHCSFLLLEHQLEGSCLFLLQCLGSTVCWSIPPFYVLRHCFIIFTRQSLKLSGILLVRSSHSETKVFKATTFLLVCWAINLTQSYSLPFSDMRGPFVLLGVFCLFHGQCCIKSCFKQTPQWTVTQQKQASSLRQCTCSDVEARI